MNGVVRGRAVVGGRLLEQCHDEERSFFVQFFPLYSRADEIKTNVEYIVLREGCTNQKPEKVRSFA